MSDESTQEPQSGLSERDRAILELEAGWTARQPVAGTRERVARERFGLSGTRYWQVVNGLLETREALEAFPVLVNRLRRQREQRSRAGRRRP